MERELAAIVVGDVAGYSGSMGADEEGTLNASSQRQLVDCFVAADRGRTFNNAGDNVQELAKPGCRAVRAQGSLPRIKIVVDVESKTCL